MIRFIPPLVLKTTIIVLTLKFSVISASMEDSQKKPPLLSVSVSETPEIYKRFKIKNFTAVVNESTIFISWNIEETKRPDNPKRPLTIFENSKIVYDSSITIEDFCKVDGKHSKRCQFQYHRKAECVNYKFILGGPINEALITTVPVKNKTTTFELTDNESNPVKLAWKIECNATSMYPVPVSINTNNSSKTVNHTLEAVCNSTHKICEIYLNRTVLDPCRPISSIININGESILLNASTIYSRNSKISVLNLNEIAIEWTETMTQITCPVPSYFNYKLVIKDDEKNQTVQDVLVQNWCIIAVHRNSQRRQLNFNKNGQSSPCNGRENNFVKNFVFNSTLKSCVDYTVYVFRSEIGKPTLETEVYKKSFVIKSLEPEDIQNLRVANLSSSRFELQWEISTSCRKVENFTVSITEKNMSIENIISLSPYNTKCDDNVGTCTVSWMYDQNVASCIQYFIHVGRSTTYFTTPPPGTVSFLPDSSKSNNSSSFSVEWNVPKQCRELLVSNRSTNESNENSAPFISSASAIHTDEVCKDEYCLMRWRFEKKLEPCTTYKLNLGLFTQDITTLPDFYGGIANNVTIRREVSESRDKSNTTLVIRWNHPHCQKTKILEWGISIRNSRGNAKIEHHTISNLEYVYKYVSAKACDTYGFAIQTIFENGNDVYLTEEKHFQADCLVKILVPISVIAGLLFIAIIIALFLSRKWKNMEALEKDTEHSVNKRSPLESRIPSTSHGRLSFNRNRTSCAIHNSRNSFDENAEMDLDSLPQMTKRPLNIRDICSFDVEQARMEFFLINKLAEIETRKLPRTIAERPENKIKNRFLNTHPYDFNRVLLFQSEDDQNDGYINASFIPGFAGKENEYIAAQGPKHNTLGDFWQMILEQDVKLIAMVTSVYECGKKKCEKYWPGEDEFVIYGDDTQLELLQETTYSFYTIRNILVTKAPDVKREIQQFHFTAWPDFETPDQPEELIRFIEIVRRQARQWNLTSPIVVHCSAGVGRTGTFIALDYLIQQVLITDLVDIPKTVRHLRRFRLSMVQSEAQYIFLYSCIAHYVKTRLNQTEGK